MKVNHHRKQWLVQSAAGLALVGFGACLIAEAAILKFNHVPTSKWVIAGTLSLIVFNSGLCLFGNGILHKVRFEKQKDTFTK